MKRYIHFVIIGICCGILLGLALSPVIGNTLSAIIAFVITLMGIASGVTLPSQTSTQKFEINPAPLSLLLIGIIMGSFIGIHMRASNSLGVNIAISADGSKVKATEASLNPNNVTGLHNASIRACAVLGTTYGDELRTELEKLGDAKVDSCLSIAKDSTSLEIIKILICQ